MQQTQEATGEAEHGQSKGKRGDGEEKTDEIRKRGLKERLSVRTQGKKERKLEKG